MDSVTQQTLDDLESERRLERVANILAWAVVIIVFVVSGIVAYFLADKIFKSSTTTSVVASVVTGVICGSIAAVVILPNVFKKSKKMKNK